MTRLPYQMNCRQRTTWSESSKTQAADVEGPEKDELDANLRFWPIAVLNYNQWKKGRDAFII